MENLNYLSNQITYALYSSISYSNIIKIPRLKKICISTDIKTFSSNKIKMKIIKKELFTITEAFPSFYKSKKNLKSKTPTSFMLNLTGKRMYKFLVKCIKSIFYKLNEFNDLSSNSIDINGNYTFYIKDRFIFPEIEYNDIDTNRGYIINIITTAKNFSEGLLILKKIKIPFN